MSALSAIVGASSLYVRGTGAGRYSTAFFAMTGICVIGLYIAYAIPIYLRLTNPDFQTGPWNLKGYHKIVGWTSIVWIAFITVLFFAPLFWPFWPIWGSKNLFLTTDAGDTFFRQNNFNFTGPLILLAAIFILGYWTFSGKKWFTGPKVQGTKEELLAIERELDALNQISDLRRHRDGAALPGGPISRLRSADRVRRVGEPALEFGPAGQALAVAQPFVGVRHEVGVERADRLLHDRPHPFAETRSSSSSAAAAPTPPT